MVSGREPSDGFTVLSGQKPSDGFTVLPSVHVAERRVVHLVEDGHVPEAVRTGPLQCALAFQEEGAEWLHLVMTEEHGGLDMDSASRIIDALDMIARHGERIGVSLPVRSTDRGHRVAGLGGTDSDDLWEVLAVLDGAGCARYVVTDVSRKGSLTGPNLPLLQEVCARTPAAVPAAGGITTLAELKTIATHQPMGVEGALIGRTLYVGTFTLPEALQAVP